MADNTTIDDLKAPLLAALGAADLALATVNDLLLELRDRAEETRTDTRSRVEESRARLTKLQEDLPEQLRSSSAVKRSRPLATTSWSSVARPPWSAFAASLVWMRSRGVPRATSTRRS